MLRHPGWRGTAPKDKYPQSVSQGTGDAGVIGRILGGRYRLVTYIGAGRFTRVYLAYDLSLSRRVAVKLLSEDVLPEQLTPDGALASRFLAAAEEAAAIAHPRLTAVYDWGESDIGLYTVCEYLAGGSLLGMLRGGHLLSASQTLMVGLDVARALEHLHSQETIHRDVRPSNILFDSRGRARLADLGTSWVLTSSETGGALMARSVFSAIDAVRYASPEQSQGLAPDHKSDVYSLVLVLTEALSGRVPFESDDPEYTQMAKMSRHLDLAGQYGRLGRVLESAGRPDRDERPTAQNLARGLLAAAEAMPRPAPLPLAKAGLEIPSTDETAAVGRPEGLAEVIDSPRQGRKAIRRLLVALVTLALLGGAGIGVYALWESQYGTDTQPVPNLAEVGEADLSDLVSEFGWVLERLERRQDGTEVGQVLSQDPLPGTGLEEGETVTVWVSLGPELVVIPGNLVGIAVEDAVDVLSAVGLSVGEITEQHSEEVVEGAIIKVDELFPDVEPGGSVDLLVSLGPTLRTVPDVAENSSLATAEEMLQEIRLGVLVWEVPSNLVEEGRVVRVEPSPGTAVPADSVVTLVVSSGPEQVRVPLLASLGVDDATAILAEVGLCIASIDGPPESEILATNPLAGEDVGFGTCIVLITRPDEDAEEAQE